jgi:hypothetical protein
VLCYLEGLTRDEAAHRLGWPANTLKSRLEQARHRLRSRLDARGLALSGTLVASLFHERTASAAASSALFDSTIKAATAVTAGGPLASVVAPRVADLTKGALKSMFFNKIKWATAAMLLAVLGIGSVVMIAGAAAEPTTAETPKTADAKPQSAAALVADKKEFAIDEKLQLQLQKWTWHVTAVGDAGKTLTLRRTSNPFPCELQFEVAADAKIVIDGKEGKPADIRKFSDVTVVLAKDKPIITRIEGTRSEPAKLKRIDADKKTFTVFIEGKEWTAPMSKEVTVKLKAKSAKPADLKERMLVAYVRFAAEDGQLVIAEIHSNGQILPDRE